jgi:RNA polymerase sigma-70 factor (ECF subfamily)
MDLATLVGEIAGGSELALTQLYDDTVDWVYGFIRRIVGDPALAEDAMQDVYCDVWKRAATYDSGRGSQSAWLCQLARSRALDRLRARRRQERLERSVDWNMEQQASEALNGGVGGIRYFETEAAG